VRVTAHLAIVCERTDDADVTRRAAVPWSYN